MPLKSIASQLLLLRFVVLACSLTGLATAANALDWDARYLKSDVDLTASGETKRRLGKLDSLKNIFTPAISADAIACFDLHIPAGTELTLSDLETFIFNVKKHYPESPDEAHTIISSILILRSVKEDRLNRLLIDDEFSIGKMESLSIYLLWRWKHAGKSEKDVFKMLKLNDMGGMIFGSPFLKLYMDYVTQRHRKNPGDAALVMYKRILSAFDFKDARKSNSAPEAWFAWCLYGHIHIMKHSSRPVTTENLVKLQNTQWKTLKDKRMEPKKFEDTLNQNFVGGHYWNRPISKSYSDFYKDPSK